MYLKRLTMKGFKSFADTTALDLEPGVTVVVGPNGSGKSNVVDAIGWVLGAQAPSAVPWESRVSPVRLWGSVVSCSGRRSRDKLLPLFLGPGS
jgi:AAA15 family ATPase/GTPase